MLKSPLREEPREQLALVIRSKNESSLLEWLESSGRMIARETQEVSYSEEEEEEISELIAVDEISYDIDDDEDSIDLDD